VEWHASIKHCVAIGGSRFLELGYGSSLTKLGFFIERRAVFEAFDSSRGRSRILQSDGSELPQSVGGPDPCAA